MACRPPNYAERMLVIVSVVVRSLKTSNTASSSYRTLASTQIMGQPVIWLLMDFATVLLSGIIISRKVNYKATRCDSNADFFVGAVSFSPPTSPYLIVEFIHLDGAIFEFKVETFPEFQQVI